VVITAGAFNGNEAIVNAMLLTSRDETGHRAIEFRPIVSDLGARNQDVAVEIGEHPFGPRLGTIDADDAEVLGANLRQRAQAKVVEAIQ
jgi:hypothetical protein